MHINSRLQISSLKFAANSTMDDTAISTLNNKTLVTVAVLCMLIIIVLILFLIRENQSKKQLKNRIRELEAKDLKSQMNPHFLFNAINNLQGIIAQQNDEATYDYISNMNVLTSSTYTMSQSETVTLDDEIRYLNAYLTINKYRLNNEFTFSFDIAEDIIPEVTYLPPLFIQPLIENSIIHGLKPKEGKKLMTLSFTKQDETLVVGLKDNGIGRRASAILKNKTKFVTHSLSSKIFDKRLALYNTTNEFPIEINYKDAYPEDTNYPGTEATLKIPL